MEQEKALRWLGSSYADLLAFPYEPRKTAGFQLGKIQAGLDPDDWKPMSEIGAGVREIRIRDSQGIYRILYVAKFDEAIYVLHCFQKKTQTTSQPDKQIAQTRYRALLQER